MNKIIGGTIDDIPVSIGKVIKNNKTPPKYGIVVNPDAELNVTLPFFTITGAKPHVVSVITLSGENISNLVNSKDWSLTNVNKADITSIAKAITIWNTKHTDQPYEPRVVSVVGEASPSLAEINTLPTELNMHIVKNLVNVANELLEKKKADEQAAADEVAKAAAESEVAERDKREKEEAERLAKEAADAAEKAAKEKEAAEIEAEKQAAKKREAEKKAAAEVEAARQRQAAKEEQERLAEEARKAKEEARKAEEQAAQEKAAKEKADEDARIAAEQAIKAEEDVRQAEAAAAEANQKENEAKAIQEEALQNKKYKANVSFKLAVKDRVLYASQPEIQISELEGSIEAEKITSGTIDDILVNQLNSSNIKTLINDKATMDLLSSITTSFTTDNGNGNQSITNTQLDVLKIDYELYLNSQSNLYIKIGSIEKTNEQFNGVPISSSSSNYEYKYDTENKALSNFLRKANYAYTSHTVGNIVVGGKSRRKYKKQSKKQRKTKKQSKNKKKTKKHRKNNRKTRR